MPVFVRNLLVGLAFVPMLLMVLLIAGVRYAWMDTVTVRMPMGVRSAMAAVMMTKVDYGKDSTETLDRGGAARSGKWRGLEAAMPVVLDHGGAAP